MSSASDPKIVAQVFYEGAYAGAKLVRLSAVPDSYHFIMQDQLALFATALDSFLTNK
jgi:hypothetical protein